MAKSLPAWANRIWASLLGRLLTVLAPPLSHTVVVAGAAEDDTGAADEGDRAAPAAPTARARGPPSTHRDRRHAAGGPGQVIAHEQTERRTSTGNTPHTNTAPRRVASSTRNTSPPPP